MTVTFCGHADFYGSEDVRVWLKETVEGLIPVGRPASDILSILHKLPLAKRNSLSAIRALQP